MFCICLFCTVSYKRKLKRMKMPQNEGRRKEDEAE